MAKLEPDDKLIRKLAALLDETGLSEIEYEADGQRIRVGRGTLSATAAAPGPQMPAAAAAAADELPAGVILSPMVGTVYVANEPGAAPLVKVGDGVTEGQPLLIIEAMKVMNPLTSPRAGTVTRIFASDGQPVEFGEPLIVVE